MPDAIKLDPIRFEVIRNALVVTTEEMAAALRHSAYSTNIKTRCDFSCALFDSQLRCIAQSFSQANHLGSMILTVRTAVTEYGPENIEEGDAIVVNYPYPSGVHLNDITLIAPIYYKGTIFGYVANLAHHVDVGGGAPASIGCFREIYQEGVIIPPTKIVQSGKILRDVYNLIIAQIRSKRETGGDFRAQIAANMTGIRRFSGLLERMGPDVLPAYIDELIAYTYRRTAADLKTLPKGVYATVGCVDNDGFTDDPVRLVAKIIIDDEGVFFDLTGSDPQRRAPVNSTYAMTYSACAYVLKCLVDTDIPVNGGFYDHLRLLAPERSVVNCTQPFPVVGGWETHLRLVDLLFKALSNALPDQMPAGTKGMVCHAGFGGLDEASGDYFCFLETLGGGYGGRAFSDGPDAVQVHGQNTQNAPIEETELNYPVRISRYELVNDSDGPGKYRGGLGLRRDYMMLKDDTYFTILADRDRWGPWGLFGGAAGEKASYILNPDGEARDLGSRITVQTNAGDVVSYRTCGGGGYGPAEERDPQLVLRDVREGKVSAERGREFYKVAIDTENWTLDLEATARLRSESNTP